MNTGDGPARHDIVRPRSCAQNGVDPGDEWAQLTRVNPARDSIGNHQGWRRVTKGASVSFPHHQIQTKTTATAVVSEPQTCICPWSIASKGWDGRTNSSLGKIEASIGSQLSVGHQPHNSLARLRAIKPEIESHAHPFIGRLIGGLKRQSDTDVLGVPLSRKPHGEKERRSQDRPRDIDFHNTTMSQQLL